MLFVDTIFEGISMTSEAAHIASTIAAKALTLLKDWLDNPKGETPGDDSFVVNTPEGAWAITLRTNRINTSTIRLVVEHQKIGEHKGRSEFPFILIGYEVDVIFMRNQIKSSSTGLTFTITIGA